MQYKESVNLSIVIPALNEADIINDTLLAVKEYMAKDMPHITYEVIVVAAQDKDNTELIANNCKEQFEPGQLIVISPEKRVGKGRDVALGFKNARGGVQIFTDADLAIPLTCIKPAYKTLCTHLRDGNDAAVFGIRSQKHAKFNRKFISFCGSLITRVLFLTYVTDLQCGFKGFTVGAAKIGFANLQTQGWAFDVEVFAKLQNHQIKVIALPIKVWRNDSHHLKGENLAKASVTSFISMLAIRFRTFSLATIGRKLKFKQR